jgi:phytoene synthase
MSTYQAYTWERPLLELAREARLTAASRRAAYRNSQAQLKSAYAHCEAITAEHSRSFSLASSLLPPRKRMAVRALYAFCRIADDIVDNAGDNPAQALAAWRSRVLTDDPPADDLVAVAWADARARYHIPQRYAEQLLEGVGRDLRQQRYETFDDLASYAYGVASTVGLMSMHIIGYSGQEAIPYAIRLGVALQLTNILRDVGEDWRNGRVYLPQKELAEFGLAESDLGSAQVDERWRAFMRFQIERNRRLYAEAWPGIAMLGKDGRLAVAAAGELYRAILEDIELHDYDVFNCRAHISIWGKLRRLPAIWLHSR